VKCARNAREASQIIFFMGIISILLSIPDKNAVAVAYPGQKNQCPDFWNGDAMGNCLMKITKSLPTLRKP
jgi:hypothetical protein